MSRLHPRTVEQVILAPLNAAEVNSLQNELVAEALDRPAASIVAQLKREYKLYFQTSFGNSVRPAPHRHQKAGVKIAHAACPAFNSTQPVIFKLPSG